MSVRVILDSSIQISGLISEELGVQIGARLSLTHSLPSNMRRVGLRQTRHAAFALRRLARSSVASGPRSTGRLGSLRWRRKVGDRRVSNEHYILTLSCPNRPGIVAGVSARLFAGGGDITEAHQFDDPDTRRFFARLAFRLAVGSAIEALTRSLASVLAGFGAEWSLKAPSARPRVLILASRFDHCLADLLYRWRVGELKMDVAGIVSNHSRETYAGLDFGGIAFYPAPADKDAKAQAEAEIWRVVQETRSDVVVLARYMQVLSDELVGKLGNSCVNIHHSFLPSFKGAKPYHQAHVRGVKLIGATAHFVTADLDEGPIIEQDVEHITHSDSPDDLVRKGRDIERRVLARALRLILDNRVLINGHKTVVFKS